MNKNDMYLMCNGYVNSLNGNRIAFLVQISAVSKRIFLTKLGR